jgi:hypothetical protein
MEWKRFTSKNGVTSDLETLKNTSHFYLSQIPEGCFFMYASHIYLKTACCDSDNFPLSFAIASGEKFEYAGKNPVVLLVTGTITIGSEIVPLDN